MRIVVVFVVLLVLSSCGYGPPIAMNVDSLDSEQRDSVVLALTDMNEMSGRTIVALEGSGYPIYFEFADFDRSNRLGLAETRIHKCTIYFSNTIRDNSNSLYNVTMHEIGHCYGLGHTDNHDEVHEVMNPLVPNSLKFSGETLDRFVFQLMNCVNIH